MKVFIILVVAVATSFNVAIPHASYKIDLKVEGGLKGNIFKYL